MSKSPFSAYHAHLYFPLGNTNDVESLVNKIKSNFNLNIGRIIDKPIGPHPIGSCQVTVPQELFSDFIPWLSKERGELDVFIHALSGDDLADHTQYIMWLGNSHQLNLDMFK